MTDILVANKPSRNRRTKSAGARAPKLGLDTPALSPRAMDADEARLQRLLALEIGYMTHPSFEEEGAEPLILAEMPEAEKGGRRVKAPKGLPPYLADLYEDPLLTREQELHLFRQMNYLRFRAATLKAQLDPEKATVADLDAIEAWLERGNEVKNRIIRANLRLVVSIAKRHVAANHNFFELVSDGNMSLIRAVEKFDFSRGNKFSTYASWAIMNNFARSIPGEAHRRSRFITGFDEMFESATDNRGDEIEQEGNRRHVRETVQGMLSRLDDRERKIISSRFGLDGAMELTLEQLGRELGITKERVRQLESRAQDKLRKFASERRIDGMFI
ncbi:MAG: sigma-70 family RNA polymerase sigma factor [Isosphaeraceae bacterium]